MVIPESSVGPTFKGNQTPAVLALFEPLFCQIHYGLPTFLCMSSPSVSFKQE